MHLPIEANRREIPKILIIGSSDCNINYLLTGIFISCSSKTISVNLPGNHQITTSFLDRLKSIHTSYDLAIYITKEPSKTVILEINKISNLVILVSNWQIKTNKANVKCFNYNLLKRRETYQKEIESMMDTIKYSELSPTHQTIIDMQRKLGIVNTREVAKICGVTGKTVERANKVYKETCRKYLGTIIYAK